MPELKYPAVTTGAPWRSFAAQMDLDQLDDRCFASTAGALGGYLVPFKGRMRPRTYGGHVYAQAAWAAAQTVAEGFVMHSMSGYFVSAGWADVPFIYRVRVVRDGKSYAVRNVEVSQVDTDGLCFTCTCSFKTPEASVVEQRGGKVEGMDVQDPVPPEVRYREFLKGKKPQDYGELVFKSPEALYFNQKRGFTASLMTMKIGMLPMGEFNASRHPIDRVSLFYYSIAGPIPTVQAAPNLHVANHLYLADQMAVGRMAEHHGVRQYLKSLASLSTTVIFHYGADALSMYDKDGNERWFCQEMWSDRLADGRGLHRSRIWDDQGRHVASTIQDGQLRLKFQDKAELDEVKKENESKAKI